MKNLLFLIKKGQGSMDRVDLKYQWFLFDIVEIPGRDHQYIE